MEQEEGPDIKLYYSSCGHEIPLNVFLKRNQLARNISCCVLPCLEHLVAVPKVNFFPHKTTMQDVYLLTYLPLPVKGIKRPSQMLS